MSQTLPSVSEKLVREVHKKTLYMPYMLTVNRNDKKE